LRRGEILRFAQDDSAADAPLLASSNTPDGA
jgi:hypothetical protein